MPANAGGVNAARHPCVIWETSASLNTTPDKKVYEISAWRLAVLWPFVALLKLWNATLRIEISDEDRALLGGLPGGILFLVWHNRLFAVSEMARRFRPHSVLHGMISASRDGAWLAAFFKAYGLAAVRGSSSRLGTEAAHGGVELLRSGKDLGITPDGPRGPVYTVKPGAFIVAKRAHARVVLMGIDVHSAWRVRSWDGFYVPKPFSRLRLRLQTFDVGPFEDRDEGAREIARALAAMNTDTLPAPVRKRA